MTNSILLQGVTPEDLKDTIRQVVSEELTKHYSPKKEESVYLNRKEVSERLRISLPTLHTYTKSGRIPAHRIGSRVLYRNDEVEAALKQIRTIKN